jgi:hypothetical protein
MHSYCHGSWRSPWCRRLAHYVVRRTEDHAGAGSPPYRIARSSARDAMFCKQHAEEFAWYRNAILHYVNDEARTAGK